MEKTISEKMLISSLSVFIICGIISLIQLILFACEYIDLKNKIYLFAPITAIIAFLIAIFSAAITKQRGEIYG